MTSYRKKPVVIEAKQWNGENADEIQTFLFDGNQHAAHGWVKGQYVEIGTLEGLMVASIGDWIIKGVAGEFYPCKPEIFAATYDEVPQAPNSTLPPYQQRVLDEKQELDIRITKLDEFIQRSYVFNTLPTDEQSRLKRQLDVQRELSVILGDRIDGFAA